MAESEKNIHDPYTEPIFYFREHCTDSDVRNIVNLLRVKHLPEGFRISEAFDIPKERWYLYAIKGSRKEMLRIVESVLDETIIDPNHL